MQLLRFLVFALCFSSALPLLAEPEVPYPTPAPASSHAPTDIVVVRGSEALQSPHVMGYRMVEWAQLRSIWLLPDIGYYDTGNGKDQLWFVGGGIDLPKPHVEWSEEIYVAQAAGPEAHNERSMWLWTVFEFNLRKRLTAELVCYPTLPLNRSQDWGFDIDRGKLEWAVKPHWLIGPGYSGTSFSSKSSWQSKPFATVTRKTGTGNYEFWLQRIPGGTQAQFRYMLVHREKQ